MEATRLKIEQNEHRCVLAKNLIKWQKNAQEKRISLAKLAQKLHCTVRILQNMLVKGPRKHLAKAEQKITFLQCAKRVYVPRGARHSRRETSTTAFKAAGVKAFAKRTARRIVLPLAKVRRARRLKKRRYNRKNSGPISEDQLRGLMYHSRSW